MQGWSRYIINGGNIEDVCVVTNSEGTDVLYLTVGRTVQGVKKLYIEAIADWTFDRFWNHVGSSVAKQLVNTNVVAGLNHLEGKRVQVLADNTFLGTYVVQGGEIELLDQIGNPLQASLVYVGLPEPCRLITLPPNKDDPGAKERYSQFSVRILSSAMPIINGERPRERRPDRSMHLSQSLTLFADLDVAKLGWETTQFISIEENTPLRVSVLGVYGRLTGNSL